MSQSFVSPTPSLNIVAVVSAMAMTLDKSQIPLYMGVVDEQNGDAEAAGRRTTGGGPNGGGAATAAAAAGAADGDAEAAA